MVDSVMLIANFAKEVIEMVGVKPKKSGNQYAFWCAAVEEFGIRLIHLFIIQGEMNQYSQYGIVYSSLSLNNRSLCTGRHVRLTFHHFL
jgi:hypothetical protein